MAKILLVDDDELLVKLYINKLTAEGHEVTYASDGLKAQELLVNTYDLIILDIMVPKVDGMSLLGTAKKGKNARTTILIYTNLLNESVKQEALKLGASAFLFKADFTPFTFIDTIKTYIK